MLSRSYGKQAGACLVIDLAVRFKGLARRIGVRGAQLLFPAVCLGCRGIVASPGTFCASCWRGIHFLDPPWCAVSGVPFPHDLGAEAVLPEVIARPPAYDRARAAVAYDGVARQVVQALKYHDRTDVGPWMAAWMVRAGRDLFDEGAVVVPVPLHRSRLLRRRFNQAAELARAVSSQTGLAFAPQAVKRVKATPQQVGLKAAEREANVRTAFDVPAAGVPLIAGRTVVVVDDVLTTGATVNALARTLKRKGGARVHVLTFARVLPETFRQAPSIAI